MRSGGPHGADQSNVTFPASIESRAIMPGR
jgi:hypothetical protein